MLEQIKHREDNVSLRSNELLNALSNFYEAYINNPSLTLKFRYTTNSKPAEERNIVWPGNIKTGIEACQFIAMNNSGRDDINEIVRLIKKIYIEDKKDNTKIENFKQFINKANYDEVISFLKKVEWSVEYPECDTLNKIIEDKLVENVLAPEQKAKIVADRLKVTVMERLSQPGDKILNKIELFAIVDDPDLSESEKSILQRIKTFETKIASDLKDFKQSTEHNFEKIRTKIKDLTQFINTQDKEKPQFIIDRPIPQLDEPPESIKFHIMRERLIDKILENKAIWLHIYGSTGMGKTHLAKNIYTKIKKHHKKWITLKDTEGKIETNQHIKEQLISILVNITNEISWWSTYNIGKISTGKLIKEIFRRNGSDNIIIIDDIPDLLVNTELINILKIVALSCKSKNKSMLITTGQRSLTPEIRQTFGSSELFEMEIPALNSEDILKMLEKSGAPKGFCSQNISNFIVSLTKGHPLLATATLRALESEQWILDDKSLEEILSGKTVTDEKDNIARKLVKLLPIFCTSHF